VVIRAVVGLAKQWYFYFLSEERKQNKYKDFCLFAKNWIWFAWYFFICSFWGFVAYQKLYLCKFYLFLLDKLFYNNVHKSFDIRILSG